MVATLIGRRLSRVQCDMLIDHIDQVRPVRRSPGTNEDASRNSLITKGLIRYVQNENIVGRPKGTILTLLGREVVCAVLAVYADSLVRAGMVKERFNYLSPADLPPVATDRSAKWIYSSDFRDSDLT